jgi:hypothetical protein
MRGSRCARPRHGRRRVNAEASIPQARARLEAASWQLAEESAWGEDNLLHHLDRLLRGADSHHRPGKFTLPVSLSIIDWGVPLHRHLSGLEKRYIGGLLSGTVR